MTDARHAVRDVLGYSGIAGDVSEIAQLLVSEAVANGVRHAHSDVRVVVNITDRIRIEAWDDDPSGAPRPQHAPPSADHGRGMDLIDALAVRWGCERGAGEKQIWFELPGAAPLNQR